MRVDEENGRALVMNKVRLCKVWRFSSNKFWKIVYCLVSDPTFGIGWSRLWDKDEGRCINLNKRKIHFIRVKIDFYEVCVYSILFLIFSIIL